MELFMMVHHPGIGFKIRWWTCWTKGEPADASGVLPAGSAGTCSRIMESFSTFIELIAHELTRDLHDLGLICGYQRVEVQARTEPSRAGGGNGQGASGRRLGS